MKKIVLILMIISLCGCKTSNTQNNNNNNSNNENTPIVENKPNQKKDLLATEMKEKYKLEKYALVEANVGKSYFTPLKYSNSYLKNKELFDGCDIETSGYSIVIEKKDEVISAKYKLIINCDKNESYDYNNIDEI